MSRDTTLSADQARALAIDAQGLGRPAPFGKGKRAVLRAIEHLGYVQIDTISVVERAHHHVIWSRVPDYRPAILHELQAKDRSVFEYWSHAASLLPIRDYRFSLPRKRSYGSGRDHWFKKDPKTVRYVLDRIRGEGPLQAKDFEAEPGRKGGPWFEWKPAKKALEQLFMEGELMIRERRGFQKVYDLTERVLPSEVDTRVPEDSELARHLIERCLESHGLVTEAEIRYLRRGLNAAVSAALREGVEEGRIVRANVEGIESEHYYCLPESLERISKKRRTGDTAGPVSILSPFDSFVIQRKRLQKIFGFDYQIECYVPAPKRKFGYFCLPLLHRDRLVGRIDAKADRASRVLEVRGVHWDVTHRERLALRPSYIDALEKFASFNGCEKLRGEKK